MFKGLALEAGVYKTVRGESKFSKGGKLFFTCSIPVAAEEDGKEVTIWVNCVAFGRLAEALSEKLAEKGRIEIKKWILQSEDGLPPTYNCKAQWKATILSANIVDWKSGGSPAPKANENVEVEVRDIDEEDFPF